MADRRINYRVTTDTSKARSEFNKLDRTVGTVTKTIGALGIGLGARELLRFANNFKNAARDAEETRSKFVQVFSSIEDSAREAASELSDSFKLANSTAQEMLGTTGDLLVGFGFAEEKALEMATAVNRLAVDVASFSNVQGGASRASMALTKGLLGERESMKLLGIAVNENTKEFKQLVEQYQVVEGASLIQAKAQATLDLAYQQSAKAIGDFDRTQESLANRERILSERLKGLSETIGNLLIPAFESGIDSAENLAGAAERLASIDLENSPFMRGMKLLWDNAAIILRLSEFIGRGSVIQTTPEQVRELARMQDIPLGSASNIQIDFTIPSIDSMLPEVIPDINAEFETTIGIVNRVNEKIAELTEQMKFAESKDEIRRLAREITAAENEVNSLTESFNEQSQTMGILNRLYENYIEVIARAQGISSEGNIIPTQLEGVELPDRPATMRDIQSPIDLRKLQENYWQLDVMSIAAARTLTDEFNKAWRNIFGEANSLFEKFMSNLLSQIGNIGYNKLADSIFTFVGGALGIPGLASTAPNNENLTVNLRIGEQDFQAVINKGLPTAYNRATRLRKI